MNLAQGIPPFQLVADRSKVLNTSFGGLSLAMETFCHLILPELVHKDMAFLQRPGRYEEGIRRWLAVSALHCKQVSHMPLRDLKLSQVQVDELWTFVKKNTQISLDRQPQSSVSSPKRAAT